MWVFRLWRITGELDAFLGTCPVSFYQPPKYYQWKPDVNGEKNQAEVERLKGAGDSNFIFYH